jgi:hypothetical protein
VRGSIATTLLLALSIHRLWAAEVVPLLEDQHIGVEIRQVPFPRGLSRDLKSGLTSRLLVRVVLLPGQRTGQGESRPIAQKTFEMAVKYDLWDENFAVTSKIGDTAAMKETLASLSEIMTRLEDLKLPNLFATSGLEASRGVVLKVDLLLDPIEKERMEQIRKWVAENTTHTAPVDPDRPASTPPLVDSGADLIFNRIFEQYAAGAEVAASWHSSLESKPFTLNEPTHVR